jgi:hypothetical protein
MMDEDGRPDWHDQRGVVWAAGAAAVALVGLLVVAVVRTSSGSVDLPYVAPPATSAATTAAGTSLKTPSATTSYTAPSVQTSQATGPVAPGSPPEASTEDAPAPEPTTSTTINNPYGTTAPTNAGHV